MKFKAHDLIPSGKANYLIDFVKCKTGILYLFLIFYFVFQSCTYEGPTPNEEPTQQQCSYEELSGRYIFFSKTDISEQEVEFYTALDSFTTTGLSGYHFWYPASPLSGHLDNCDIILNTYSNVKRKGLSSPGGFPRYYYESLTGYGQFFPENDSIMLFIHYTRTEDFPLDWSGNLYFKKIH